MSDAAGTRNELKNTYYYNYLIENRKRTETLKNNEHRKKKKNTNEPQENQKQDTAQGETESMVVMYAAKQPASIRPILACPIHGMYLKNSIG